MSEQDKYFLWCDLETTGLDYERDKIVEVAVILTDEKLNEIWRYSTAVRTLDWSNANPWVLQNHGQSGLVAECFAALLSIGDVDREVYDKLSRSALYPTEKALTGNAKPPTIILAGSSVHFDRRFIDKYMPHTMALLHYRHLDVSALMEAFKIVGVKNDRPKAHRALADIDSSIAQLKELLEYVRV